CISVQWKRPYTSVLIVPTGVGASIGGYAGDALPVARTLASVADCVISHPNVTLSIGIEEELRIRHLQVVDATRASLGLPVLDYIVTDTPLEGIDLLAGVEAIISHLVLGYTFLPCVLAGLANAPQYLTDKPGSGGNDCIAASDVDSIILPADACGGDGVLAFAHKRTKVKVSNYWEAIGVVAAHKAGVDPNSLRRDKVKNITTNSLLHSNGCVTTTFA
ncbi:Protein of unknown function DUF3326, partial [Cynara cardunculus var. scolymus]